MSGSAGIFVPVTKTSSVVFNYSSSFRAPALEELYNLGRIWATSYSRLEIRICAASEDRAMSCRFARTRTGYAPKSPATSTG